MILYNHFLGAFCKIVTQIRTPLQYQDPSYLKFHIFLRILDEFLLHVADLLVWLEYNIIFFNVKYILGILRDYAMLVTISGGFIISQNSFIICLI